jgi:hypothetical protein
MLRPASCCFFRTHPAYYYAVHNCNVPCHFQGIDWASLNVEGQPLKPDLLTDAWTACEPSDAPPPGKIPIYI